MFEDFGLGPFWLKSGIYYRESKPTQWNLLSNYR